MLRWTRQTFLSLWSLNIFLIEMFTKMALPVVECSPRKECGHPQKKVNSASSNDNRSGRYSKNRFWKNAALWICMNCCVIKRRSFEYLKDKDLEQRDVLIFAQYFFGLGKITSWRRDNVYEELFKIQSTFHTFVCTHAESLQLCLTHCDALDSNLPGSPVHGTLQARTLEWTAVPSSGGSSWPQGWTPVSYTSCTGKQVLCHEHRLSYISRIKMLTCSDFPFVSRERLLYGQWPKEMNLNDKIHYS